MYNVCKYNGCKNEYGEYGMNTEVFFVQPFMYILVYLYL